MVSRGQVTSDCSDLQSIFSQYDSYVGELSSSWEGDSYNNLSSKASEFSSEYSSTITSQMSAFAEALSAYEQYKVAKSNYEISVDNYNVAKTSNDTDKISYYRNQISSFDQQVKQLKSQIESSLASAASKRLDPATPPATPGGVSGIQASARGSNAVIQGAMDWAIGIANDDSHGYSQNTRWGNPNYDCSSLVISAYNEAGVPVKDAGATYTGNMKSAFTSVGFKWIPGDPNVNDLQPGDVLLDEKNHTEMYIGDGKNVGAHSNYDGTDGDSSGKEINVKGYYSHPWDGVLRYVGTEGGNEDE